MTSWSSLWPNGPIDACNTGTTASNGTSRGYFGIKIDKKISIGYSPAQKRLFGCWVFNKAISTKECRYVNIK